MPIENIDEMEKISTQFDEAFCRGQLNALIKQHSRLLGLVASIERELKQYSEKLDKLRNGEKGEPNDQKNSGLGSDLSVPVALDDSPV